MASAPRLKVIEGGRAAADAPALPPARESERLYPVFDGSGGKVFILIVALSLIVHGAILAASIDWTTFGEERPAGGSDEAVVIDGIDVILLDRMPSVLPPLAEAPRIEYADPAEPVDDTEAALDTTTTPAERLSERVAPLVEADRSVAISEASIRPDGTETRVATVPADRSRPVPDRVARSATDDSIVASENDVGVALTPRDDDVALLSADETNPASGDAAARLVETPKAKPIPPGDTAVIADDAVRPALAPDIVATEMVAEPPLPRKNPHEFNDKTPQAKTETASAAPKASSATSVASRAAHGPSKAEAGAGGKDRSARGRANLSSYQSKLVAHLRRYRTYPDAARSRRMKGTAQVLITIDRSGRVAGVSLAKSTGHGILDREAVAMVRRASPFPPIPSELGRAQITIRAPIRFDIR